MHRIDLRFLGEKIVAILLVFNKLVLRPDLATKLEQFHRNVSVIWKRRAQQTYPCRLLDDKPTAVLHAVLSVNSEIECREERVCM